VTSRRALLAGSATVVVATALAGCRQQPSGAPTPGATGSATHHPRGSAPPPAPAPDPTATHSAGAERRLLARAESVLGHPDAGSLAASRKRLVQAIRDGHRQHVAALTSPEPTSRPLPSTSGSPSSGRTKGSLAGALAALATAEQAAVAGYRTSAAGSVGFGSLLYASLAAAAQGYATALDATDPATPIGGTTRPVLAPWTEIEAEQNLLAATHAMLYGYKAALGFVSETSGTGKRMLARVLDYQRLRDRLTGLVVDGRQQPTAAEPAYRLPVRVTGTASATDLARRLEIAVQPHFGRCVAAATAPAVHRLALSGLADAGGTALSWGAGVSAWPGWPR
jgi:hypothetical protein